VLNIGSSNATINDPAHITRLTINNTTFTVKPSDTLAHNLLAALLA
jgi:hypothetical protein